VEPTPSSTPDPGEVSPAPQRSFGTALFKDRTRAGSFGDVADLYDRARPRYPLVLIERLTADRPRTLLDVGCGTGIAARQFAAAGLDVLGVEPDPRMAAVARRHGITVEVGQIETWDPVDRRFDLLISAQAWHWVDPVDGVAKAAEVVRPGGRIGLFWNVGRPPGDLRERFDAAYTSLAPGLEEYSVLLGRGESDRRGLGVEQLAGHPGWIDVEVDSYPFDITYTTETWLANLETHSDHRTLPSDQHGRVMEQISAEIDGVGGSFVMHYETALVTARRADAKVDG
jgi:SAM-dependent methyltransferase